jgi:hypothetical protein
MNMETKNQVFERYKKEYFEAKSKKKRSLQSRVLDIVCQVTRITRKAGIRKFGRIQDKDNFVIEARGRKTYYTADAIAALKDIWTTGNEACGELLFAVAKEYVAILQRDNMWDHSKSATEKLLKMSLGTMKAKVGAFLKARRKGRGFSLTSPSHLKHIIPIFSGPWKDELPGSGQIDTVAHCGATLLGNYAYTLNYLDISTLWDIARAQWNKGQIATVENIEHIGKTLPFLLCKIHPDTGSEFINWHCKNYCDTNKITMTRSRPNHKNDNAGVEERNGHIVRKYVGYIRLDCKESVDALNNLYDILCPYLNHFVASRRCIEKIRVGAKYIKRFEKTAKTPYQRVLENEHIAQEIKNKLQKEHERLNPLTMKKEIDRLRDVLYETQKKYGSQNIEKSPEKSNKLR